MASPFINTPATSERLTRAIEQAPPHFKPVLEAVRDCRIGLFVTSQSPEAFRVPRDPKRPALVLIADDFDAAFGPEGFHLPSVRRAIRDCHAFSVVACEPLPAVYATAAAMVALTRRNVMLVETRPEQELAWAGLIQKLAPGRPLLMATVKGGQA